jgi:exopolysaccharide biosynthesis polyprenyl glycosylphosphotransferase
VTTRGSLPQEGLASIASIPAQRTVSAAVTAPAPAVGRRALRRRPHVAWVLVLIDCAALVIAPIAVKLSLSSTIVLATLILGITAGTGQYRTRIAPSLLDDLPSLAGRALVAGAITTTLRAYFEWGVKDGPIYAAIAFLVLAGTGRAIAYPMIRRRRASRVGSPTLIVGCGRIGSQLTRNLMEHPEFGLDPVGYVDDDPLVSREDRRIPVLGGIKALPRLVQERRIQYVLVAFTVDRESAMVERLRTCDRLDCEIYFVPRLFELHGVSPHTEWLWGLPVTRLSRASYRTPMWRVKRLFDFTVASFSLLVLSPLLAALAIAVRIEGGPGVIFRQERVGVDGRHFTLLKFRSMKPCDDLESTTRWNIGGDPRIGRVGQFLRTTSLDELPQLWNVAKGDMSLVGPRPERPAFVDEFSRTIPRYTARHRVPAGLTGWAQVNGLRGDTDITDRAVFDNYYIENWSMWTDLKIMLRTAGQVLGRGGR